ncbi:antibiotic biosynthesis monooxygenase [Reyranella sp. CPCC 100927]|uniref:antibiotic biosynthesis monooxygenase family protein n=1 Tax=Reyranella sp. CPCC 100927 TaxID=2599616 RepID=UPI0011B45F14|nr:antibiotic biosynthesis monooxygenase [Reyranella sp. CPCC 100927]TWT03197.1 antibiotic biosynthesis monooxygenase [Reyranella sp. CPCC 100927]
MFAVIFEVQPHKERWDDYLDLAKLLKPELEKIDGFIDNERFASRRTEGRLVSLSTWRDEKAVVRWRTLAIHHGVQEKGRFEVFADYHLRVGEITADDRVPQGHQLVQQRLDETEVGAAKVITLSELSPPTDGSLGDADQAVQLGLPTQGVVDREVFESIYTPGKILLLVSWANAAAASRWTPRVPPGGTLRHRHVRVIRDYGMFDRREAPQYYPDAPRHQD